MARAWMLAIVTGLTIAQAASAQPAGWRFRWQAGQVLDYRVEHNTTVSEVVSGNKVEMASKLVLGKRWEVMNIDGQSAATLRLTLTAMRHEQTRPNGETLLFDSAHPDKSTPELREQMSKFVGQTLAVVRVDVLGKVIEVVQGGSASKYDAEPPFSLRLPPQAVNVGQAWERVYEITLEPPLGTGDKHQAVQRYTLAKVQGNLATIQLTTQLKTTPENPADRIPLLQKQPEGEIVFNTVAGRVDSIRLRTDKQLQGHQGEGSSYRFVSTYVEQYAGK